MIIEEYTELGQSAEDVALPQSKIQRTATQLLDGLIVGAYVLSLIGVMPLVITYAWAKDNWSTRDTP